MPVDKKSRGRETRRRGRRRGRGARTATSSPRRSPSTAATGLPHATVRERLGSLKSEKAVSLIAIHAHGIPHVFPPRCAGRGGAARSRRRRPAARIGARCRSSPSTRPTPRTTTTPCTPSPTTIRPIPAATSSRSPSPTSPPMCGPAPRSIARRVERGNSVYFPDRVVPMLPERISNDLCSLRPREDRPALAVRMIIGADGRKRRHSFHRVLMRSAAKLSYGQAQARSTADPDDTTGPLLEPVLKPLWAAYACAEAGARRARAARPRPAGAQDHPASRTARSTACSCPSASTPTGSSRSS